MLHFSVLVAYYINVLSFIIDKLQ